MPVYVDDFNAPLGRMVMVHMLASTLGELHAMADTIGVSRRWFQDKASGVHYDICLAKKKLALANGAIAVTARVCAAMNMRRRVTGGLGRPQFALKWRKAYLALQRQDQSTFPPIPF